MHRKYHVTFKGVGKKDSIISEEMVGILCDRKCVARHLNSNRTEVDLYATFTLLANDRLKFQNSDNYLSNDKISVIQFPTTFHKTPESLEKAISEGENPVLHHPWSQEMVDWMRREENCAQLFYILAPFVKMVLENGCHLSRILSPATIDYTHKYLTETYDPFDEWATTHLTLDNGCAIRLDKLKKAYVEDCLSSITARERHAFTTDIFKAMMLKKPAYANRYKDNRFRVRLTDGTSLRINKGFVGCKYLGVSSPEVNIEIEYSE